MVAPSFRRHRPERQHVADERQIAGRRGLKGGYELSGAEHPHMAAPAGDRKRLLQIVTRKDVVVVDEDEQRCPGLADGAQARGGQPELFLVDVTTARVPAEIPDVGSLDALSTRRSSQERGQSVCPFNASRTR
jgi:hypothetical protein